MEKKQIKKLSLRKEVVSTLTKEEQGAVHGMGTTSFNSQYNTCSNSGPCCDGTVSLPRSCAQPAHCELQSLGKYCTVTITWKE